MSTTLSRPPNAASPCALDPRGLRTAAAVTTVVLAAVLLLPSPYAAAVLVGQALVFALGAVRGAHASPYGLLFRALARPRLAAPREWEAPEPARFAQVVGLVFAIVGLLALITGATLLGQLAVGAALAAALLNAAFGFCLGCEVYLLARRLRTAPSTAAPAR